MALPKDELGTLLGPLTTTWSIPSRCTANLVLCKTCNSAYQGQRCATKKGREALFEDDPDCFPPRASDVTNHAHPLSGWGFYSPGLACPSGYTSACTAIYDERPDWEIQFRLAPDETAIGCCPVGFSCANLYGNTCIKSIIRPSQVITGECRGTDLVTTGPHEFPDRIMVTNDNGDEEEVTRTIDIMAPMFQLNFRATDLETTSEETAAPGMSETTSGPIATETDGGESTSSGSLSTGASIGIGVGVGAAMVLFLIVAIILWRRSRRRMMMGMGKAELAATAVTAEAGGSEVEYANKPPAQQMYPSELEGLDTRCVELPTEYNRQNFPR